MDVDSDFQPESGRITLEEMRACLVANGIDPCETNAGVIRRMLGNRGSLQTIQKNLGQIRSDVSGEPQKLKTAKVKRASEEILNKLWNLAVDEAKKEASNQMEEMVERCKKAEHERDVALMKLKRLSDMLSGDAK